MLGDDETLFIVTADHAHTMTIGGIYRYFIILKVVSVESG
jgi:alkaline phosphatase